MCVGVQVPAEARGGHQIDFQVIMSCLLWVLGTDLGFSGKAAATFGDLRET